ncbi:hypothetical protein [Aeromicrobium sp. UC242_57]|uniref:DUF7669 domain-containing protein n=1 Tax=Aeromicrobium sp. UC242_57 TaxID=3374624 RepID=UPI00379E27AC
MKYDRPVWKIMHECADSMPDVFRYEDVREWFFTFYPKVNEATIRAHLIGLTEGGRAKHVQFAHRSPVFRRVARGEYAPVPKAERGEDPETTQPTVGRFKRAGDSDSSAEETSEETSGKASKPAREDAHSDPSSATGPFDPTLESESQAHVFDIILLGSLGNRVAVRPRPRRSSVSWGSS